MRSITRSGTFASSSSISARALRSNDAFDSLSAASIACGGNTALSSFTSPSVNAPAAALRPRRALRAAAARLGDRLLLAGGDDRLLEQHFAVGHCLQRHGLRLSRRRNAHLRAVGAARQLPASDPGLPARVGGGRLR